MNIYLYTGGEAVKPVLSINVIVCVHVCTVFCHELVSYPAFLGSTLDISKPDKHVTEE